MKPLSEQTAARKAERLRQQRDRKTIQALVTEFTLRCVDRALADLPANASFELRRQVIREATE